MEDVENDKKGGRSMSGVVRWRRVPTRGSLERKNSPRKGKGGKLEWEARKLRVES